MIKSIHVTQEDIDKGTRREASACPVALATKRETKCTVTVGPLKMVFGSKMCPLPWDAVMFIDRFDNFDKVEPFSFDIEVPDDC